MNIENHLDLIRKIVWSYVSNYPGLEFEDLFSEACLACLEKKDKYDPSRGKETTFIWYSVHNHIRNLLGKEPIRKELPITYTPTDPETDPEQEIIAKEEWAEFMSSLSEEAKVICSIIFEERDVYLPIDTPKKCRTQITKALKERGWSMNRVWAGYREIKLTLRQVR